MKNFKNLLLLALWLLVATAHAGTVTYVYTDPQGTPLAEANASGTITARFDYAPYGQSVTSMGAAPNGPGYTGHVNDPDTGLVYMQARYYDPEVGRFLSVDPVGVKAGAIFGFNRYDYTKNNPIKNVDPDGKAPQSPILAQLTYARNYINNAYENAVVTVGSIFLNQSRRTSVSLNGTIIRNGIAGVTGSLGLANAGDSLGVTYFGKPGVEVSVDVKYRLFTIPVAKDSKNGPYELTAHATSHDGYLGGGGELVYNSGGTLSGYLMVGVGKGDAAYLGSANYVGTSESSDQQTEDERKQQAMMDEQYLRETAGFGRQNTDMLRN
ncbi:RHS repeat-associated core domain-containing protein [Rhodanobacter glycinis]|uniref:RHS repeat-associated core domain-containing protein n=1 Tax=Rhodanobacter glycinis TaxID=582702 RepID=UPI0011266400|nr:RHS repeat-associated core domain-containing protein [Rhodanobacter glycinis]TPG48475.1 RHS repeat-associated core domain-containing protein [Rhodanobacter glycinis]